MATSDRSDIELTAGNKDRIAVEPWHGRVSIFVIDGSGSVEGESHVVMEPAECDALIAAIGRALGRPTPTSTPLAFYFEEKAKVCDKGRAHGQATGNLYLQNCSKAEAETWRHAASLVVEAAHGEQGATVPRAAVAAVIAEIDALECADEDAILGIRRSLAALLATPITPQKG